MVTILLWAACGYVAAVVFPVPVVSRAILDTWAKVGAWFKSFGAKS